MLHETPHSSPREQASPQEPLSLLDYLEILARNRHMLIRNTVVALCVSVAIALMLPKKYEAVSMFLPPQQDSGFMGLLTGQMGSGMAGMASDLLGKGTSAELYASILNTETVKDKIIDKFKLMDIYGKDNRQDTYRKLEKYVDISSGKKDGIISITVEDKDAKRAAAIANAYVDELIYLTVDLSKNDSQKNRVYVEERLNQAKTNLALAEDKIKKFQQQHKTIDITEQAKGTFKGISELTAQLAVEEVKLASLKRQFTDSSQDVKSQLSIVSNIKNQINKMENSSNESSVPSLNTLPGIGQEQLRLLREFKMQEMMVEVLTKQLEINKLGEMKDVSAVQVLQKARPADKASKPKRPMLVAGITIFVLFFSMVYAFIKEQKTSMGEGERERWESLMKVLLPWRTGFKRAQ